MIPYIISPASQTVTFYLNGKREAVKLTDPRYDKIMTALAVNDETSLKALLTTTGDKFLEESEASVIFTYKDLRVLTMVNKVTIATHKGVKLSASVTDMIVKQIDAGVTSFAHIEKFLDKLIKIKSKFVAEQLYAFLEKAELPITAEGTFIAYKGIRDDNYSCHGNTSTRVTSGVVDFHGRILNSPGAYIAVERADVDTDPDSHCSTGLHVGSYSYARNFCTKLIYVEVDPLDVVSVPNDCNEKCRVCAYKVIGDTCDKTDGPNLKETKPVEQRIVENDKVRKIVANTTEAERYKTAIEQYIAKSGEKAVAVSRLRRSIGRKSLLTTDEVFRLCVSLGFTHKAVGAHLGNTLISN